MINVYDGVRYIGPQGAFRELHTGDIGNVIGAYGDGNYEVEFSTPDGVTRVQEVLPKKHLAVTAE